MSQRIYEITQDEAEKMAIYTQTWFSLLRELQEKESLPLNHAEI